MISSINVGIKEFSHFDWIWRRVICTIKTDGFQSFWYQFVSNPWLMEVLLLVDLTALSWLKTSLRLAALPLQWWYLNCAGGTWHRGKTKWQAPSSQLINYPRFCPLQQFADKWINLRVMPLGVKAKAEWLTRAVTLKWEAVIMQQNGEQQALLFHNDFTVTLLFQMQLFLLHYVDKLYMYLIYVRLVPWNEW